MVNYKDLGLVNTREMFAKAINCLLYTSLRGKWCLPGI